MRTHRSLIGAATAALLAAGALTAMPVSGAEAATARTSTVSTTQAQQTLSHYRGTRTAALRRLAARPAGSSTTLKAITNAVRSSEFTSGVPASAYMVGDLRTSGAWARVTLRPTKTAELDPATVVLHQVGSRWNVVDLGTAGVGCDVAPSSTLSALQLGCD